LLRTDEGYDYHGTDEIKAWKSKSDAHGHTVEVLHIAEVGNETVATSRSSAGVYGRSFVK
jgi:hypothetical protein